MNFLSELLIAILTGYLAFTNTVAHSLENLFLPDEQHTQAEVTTTPESGLSFLPSSLSETIPTILLQSAAYQSAALASATDQNERTADEPIDAIVNLFCAFRTDDYIRTTTGTGFFIDRDGVIMTNAHVAQFLLLEEADMYTDTECVIRTGNPAAPMYTAELLYISPAWVQDNAAVINDAVPMGTGERDYALLYVNRTVSGEPLPATFPTLTVNTDLVSVSTKGSTVTAAGYPAADLLRDGPTAELTPKQADTTVSELYTFGSNYADVLSIRGSDVGAEGASGGPVLNSEGDVIGMIVTRGDDTIDGPGSLRAITLSHIERTLIEETGFSLRKNASGDLPYRAEIFASTMTPFLLTLLTSAD